MLCLQSAIILTLTASRWIPACLAIADYRLHGLTMTIYHTEVPARLRGRGHGARLVMDALSQARSKGYKIVPSCWFVREVMSASPKYDDLWADRSSK